MMHRSPEAILAAYKMDSARRELYVEGRRDRTFLSWLLRGRLHKDATIVEISFVEIERQVDGGERGRLLHLAAFMAQQECKAFFFADADWDKLLRRDHPNVTFTDFRDLEGYLWTPECVRKMLQLGYGCDGVDAEALLKQLFSVCREIANVRIASAVHGWQLPFQRSPFRKRLECERQTISIDLDGYFRQLLQNADISLSHEQELRDLVAGVAETFSQVEDRHIVHGKDMLDVLSFFMEKQGFDEHGIPATMWCAFDESRIDEFESLSRVCSLVT